MKKIISTVLALCLLITLCVPLNALGATYKEYVAAKKAQASSFSVSIIFHKFYGGIELEFRPEWKIGNSRECFDLEDVYYTLDGSNPKNGTLFKSNPKLTEAKKYRIRAIALDDEYGWSIESDTTYMVEQLSKPEITNVQADKETTVNIFSPEGATIYYTTDSSTPTTKSTKYTGEITLTDDTKIKAVAVKEGYVTSNVAQEYIPVATFLNFTCYECGNDLSDDDTFFNNEGKAICKNCYDNQNKLLTYCNICGELIESSDDMMYDDDDNVICQDCYDELSENKQECYICGEYFNPDDMMYDDDDNLICQNCYEELSENKQECYICGEYFNSDDMLYDEDDNLICQDCYDELSESEHECYICGEYFNPDDMMYDEDDNLICQDCYEELQNDDNNEEIEFITSDWAEDEVYEAYQYDLIPEEMLKTALYKTISREEFAAVAVKLYENIAGEIPDADIYDTPFGDCNYASEYNDYIAVAYELGITNGTSDTTFSPYENITREQLAVMLSRVLMPPDNRSVSPFADHDKISQYAVDAVYFMAMHDIIKGVGDNRFAPQESATKEQAILIALRMYNSCDEW